MLIITLVKIPKFAWVTYFGNISYSLYLLHIPIGVRLIAISLRFGHAYVKVLALVLASALSIVAATLLYRLVAERKERPAPPNGF